MDMFLVWDSFRNKRYAMKCDANYISISIFLYLHKSILFFTFNIVFTSKNLEKVIIFIFKYKYKSIYIYKSISIILMYI